MRFRIEQRFDLAVEAVEEALQDPGFVERMAGLPKLGHPQLVRREVDGPTVHTQVRYAFSGELSSAVRAVVEPARLTWIEDAVTDRRTHHTRFRILPDHYANLLRCAGTFTLSAVDGGSMRLADGVIDVSVPLLGRKVERAIVSGLEDHAAAEVSLVQEWTAGSQP